MTKVLNYNNFLSRNLDISVSFSLRGKTKILLRIIYILIPIHRKFGFFKNKLPGIKNVKNIEKI